MNISLFAFILSIMLVCKTYKNYSFLEASICIPLMILLGILVTHALGMIFSIHPTDSMLIIAVKEAFKPYVISNIWDEVWSYVIGILIIAVVTMFARKLRWLGSRY